ncbi:MAG: DMT family transporter [Chitinophagaceae bacterium]|nr:DMT family transporter [Chitinophagaceae bacterium]MDP1764684.1 DMT family transporter [Sediminibacterium sp.]MDP1812283.1 DMT family transporter [Sediminibacterium sp.]MDP3128877.1 DMT family transporter [Sediminibacterium sp.]MDP3665133.1 DMT family transporter [Sediminibacterium sp.]
MKYLFFILPALAGITITTQAGVNSQLRVAINNPWVAAFISFVVGTVILGLIIIGTKQPVPSLEQLKSIELYKYAGGLLGAFFVTVIIFTVPRIGSANVFALVIASQFIMALLYDHFGLFGLPQTNISWVKILGSVMLIAGAYLVIKK